MSVLFQCLGITGIIMIFYGLLAFAITQVSTTFFWSLFLGGFAFVVTFVATTLSRQWQSILAALVTLNASWILLMVGKTWPSWVVPTAIGVCLAITFVIFMKRAAVGSLLSVLLIVAGAVTATIYLHDKPWARYNLLGVAFLANSTLLYLSYLLRKDLFQSKSLQYGTSALVYSLIVFAIIVVANVMSQDFHAQKDLTENAINTLTEQSVKLVKGLKSPVKITGFFDDRNPNKAPAKDLLDTYRFQSKSVEIEFVDPDKDKELAVAKNAKDGDIVVEHEGQTNVTQEVTEEGITKAISKVTRTTTPTVCFTKGHGELDIDGSDEENRSLSAIKHGMENEGYKSRGIDRLEGEVPADCNMLVVAGPTQAFTQGEVSTIGKFLDDGGKALLMLDPNLLNPKLASKGVSVLDSGFEGLAAKWGIELGKNVILEKHIQLLRGATLEPTVIAQNYGNHPIVDPLKGKQTVFNFVRSVRKSPGSTAVVVDLVSSAGGGASWAETNMAALFQKPPVAQVDGVDLEGPVSFGVAVDKSIQVEGSEEPRQARLVVLGDSEFVSNGMVRSYEFNFDLFLNALNWLQGESERVSIRPKRLRTSTIELTPNQSNLIFYVAIVGLPMLVLIFGMDLWWYRRRKG